MYVWNFYDESKAFNVMFARNFLSQNLFFKFITEFIEEKGLFIAKFVKEKLSKIVKVWHQAINNNLKPLKCSICPKEKFYKKKSSLNDNMKVHD